MKHYLDSSVVLGWLLEGRKDLELLQSEKELGSSVLMWTEVSRVLHRCLQTGTLSPESAASVRVRFAKFAEVVFGLRMNDLVLRRAAGPFPLVVRTLDAIHIATAEQWLLPNDEVALYSYDRQMNLCAAQLGFGTPFL